MLTLNNYFFSSITKVSTINAPISPLLETFKACPLFLGQQIAGEHFKIFIIEAGEIVISHFGIS